MKGTDQPAGKNGVGPGHDVAKTSGDNALIDDYNQRHPDNPMEYRGLYDDPGQGQSRKIQLTLKK
jgi:hypothetical protein